jgi:hypothetical protein
VILNKSDPKIREVQGDQRRIMPQYKKFDGMRYIRFDEYGDNLTEDEAKTHAKTLRRMGYKARATPGGFSEFSYTVYVK